MFDSDRPYTFDAVVRMVLAAAFLVGLIWILGYLSSVLVPFVAALLVAYLLHPVASWLQRYVKSRGAAVALTMVGVVAVMAAVVLLVVPRMVSEFAHMGLVLSKLVSNAELAGRVESHLPPDLWAWLPGLGRASRGGRGGR